MELFKQLREDKELYFAYQSNIAVQFTDAYNRFRKEHNKQSLSKKEVHQVANEAAQNFLNLLIKE